MRYILTSVFLIVLMFPALALGTTLKDLVVMNGLYYKKSNDVPFTGKVTGEYQGSFKDGKRKGPWVSYYYNGQLKWKGNYKAGRVEGPFVSYWDNGKLQSQGTSNDGEMEGPWVSYNKDGTLDKNWTGTFKNSKKISD